MKRKIVFLLLALALSLILVGCADRMDGGNVSASPAAVSATPVIPSMDVSLTPVPEQTAGREQSGSGMTNGTGNASGSTETSGTSQGSSATSGAKSK